MESSAFPNPMLKRLQRTSANSNDSMSPVNGNGTHCRGHSETNSLDRGLTLAKTLKAGPFPPPCNKSNSLKRPTETEGEEKERNSAAAGVIMQIITGILTDEIPTETLEPITSGSSSVSSPSSHVSKEKKNETEAERSSYIDNLNAHCAQEDIVSEFESRMPSTSLSSSIDPITRDVERRMSMKRDGTLNDSICDDGNPDRFSKTRFTVDHAKSLAQNYGAIASGFFRGALQKVKRAGHLGSTTTKGVDEDTTDSEGEQSDGGVPGRNFGRSIVRPRKAKKGPFDFEQLKVEQEINNEHTGAVWCIRFSVCGRLIATAGQDAIIRVWAVRSHIKYFQEMRDRYQQKTDTCGTSSGVFDSTVNDMASFRPPSSSENPPTESLDDTEDYTTLMAEKPFAVFKGHTADILDLSWSKNYFILSSGMDRTVKLWHLSRGECLCCFQHVDFVTCVAFLPKDDRYFLSGSFDGKLRMWYIPDKKVAVWNEVQVKFITAITFVKNGKFAVVGTYNGRCYFYTSDQLKYHTVVDVRSSRGKNARGHKVTGLAVHGDKLLVTSNDSRIRMYDVRDMALTCKFRGAQNDHSQIRAAFSPDGRHIVCGSEDKFVYIWRTSDLPSTLSVRKDRNAMWERVRAHNSPVSVAVFAPKPQVFMNMLDRKESQASGERVGGHVVVSADLTGSIKIMVNRPRATKAGQSTFFEAE